MKANKNHLVLFRRLLALNFLLAIIFSSCQKESLNTDSAGPSKIPTNTLSLSLVSKFAPASFPTTFTWHAPISLTGASYQTIRGLNITGGSSPCIFLNNCHDIHITKSLLQGSTNINAAVYLLNCYNIYIDTCYIKNSVRGVLGKSCTNNIRVVYNKIYNTTDPNLMSNGGGNAVQFNMCNGTGMRIDSNFIYDPTPSTSIGDKISLYQSSGTWNSYIRIYYNQIRGGSINPAGFTGIALGDGVNSNYQDAEYNIACSTGNVGMVIGGGQHMIMSNNLVYGAHAVPSSAGIMFFNNSTTPTLDININNNKINWTNSAWKIDNYWFNPNAGKVNSTGNTTPGTGDPTITNAILQDPLF